MWGVLFFILAAVAVDQALGAWQEHQNAKAMLLEVLRAGPAVRRELISRVSTLTSGKVELSRRRVDAALGDLEQEGRVFSYGSLWQGRRRRFYDLSRDPPEGPSGPWAAGGAA